MGHMVPVPCAPIAVLFFFNYFISIYLLYIVLGFIVPFAYMYVIHFRQVHSPYWFLVIPTLCSLAPSCSQPALLLLSCLILMTLIVGVNCRLDGH